MLINFKQYIESEKLIQLSDRVLIAVSGGVDSVVLCHLFHKAGLSFAIAHCNFQLRGKDSEEDAISVEGLAKRLNVSFYATKFDTQQIVNEQNASLQMVARDLRYEWLEKIRVENDYQYIATAHHLNDSLETILYNFTKGCGIRGLHGILPKRGHIIRPLLFAKKESILSFAMKNAVNYREDSSNAMDKYSRNKIRLHVIPTLKEINPNLEKTVKENIDRLRDVEQLYDFAVQHLKKELCSYNEKETLIIDFEKLITLKSPSSILYEFISPYHFNKDQVEQILKGEHLSGTQFYSKTHRLLIDRGKIIIAQKQASSINHILIYEKEKQITTTDGELNFTIVDGQPNEFASNPKITFIDYEKLNFPLKLRRWENGDKFQPLGMPGRRQKISDFFNNNKFSILEKERTWLLESKGEICWIVGHRIDERFRITDKTKRYLRIEFKI